jgi:HTH-type transcriptional repressor of NAD biosynthesis genes
MSVGFVFGKFFPFHKGHEALISHALSLCSSVYVLVCVSDREHIPESSRVRWLSDYYRDNLAVVVRGITYSESELPNTSVADREVSRVWSGLFQQILPPVDVVFTGEAYGDYVAEYMGIRHVRVARDNGVSATAIRDDLMKHWGDINSTCQRDLVRRVSIVGTESTGKSTLTAALARHFNTVCVQEAGRDLVAHTEQCTFEDLFLIAHEHARRIDVALASARLLLFVDTDLYTTKSYARFLFGKDLAVAPSISALNRADLRLYLDSSAVYVQDGTRLSLDSRNALDRSHQDVLDAAGEPYVVLSGSYEQRFQQAVALCSQLIAF